MAPHNQLNRWAVQAHARYQIASDRSREALTERMRIRDDRGDIEARAITIAFMAAAAIAAGSVIKGKIDGKANSISLN
jgi:hypothetical protein